MCRLQHGGIHRIEPLTRKLTELSNNTELEELRVSSWRNLEKFLITQNQPSQLKNKKLEQMSQTLAKIMLVTEN